MFPSCSCSLHALTMGHFAAGNWPFVFVVLLYCCTYYYLYCNRLKGMRDSLVPLRTRIVHRSTVLLYSTYYGTTLTRSHSSRSFEILAVMATGSLSATTPSRCHNNCTGGRERKSSRLTGACIPLIPDEASSLSLSCTAPPVECRGGGGGGCVDHPSSYKQYNL